MAVSLKQPSQSKTNCKLKEPQPKLLSGSHVEVRSLEEGFDGSWHAATVVDCGDSVRCVRYDHLLVDDGSEVLVEWIKVSCMIDGVVLSDGVSVNHRGVMRPVPPPFKADCWGLHYGMCVDAYVNDAWWEGVVFDYVNRFSERLVFFPDLGDEQMVKIENLRVTHDWSEISGTWTKRGDWLFLELIQEHEKELFVSVSVRQLWYDFRAKEAFRMSIKEWTCWIRAMWVDLVVEVIRDNINLTAEYFLSVVESENAVNFICGPSILPCEGILQGNEEEDQLPLASPGPRNRSGDKSDATLHCEGTLYNHAEENQLPSASPGPSTRTRSRSENHSDSTQHFEGNLHDRVEEDHIALPSSCPSQRTRSKLRSKSATTVHCEGIFQDHSEESELALTWPGPSKTTRNRSSNTSDCILPCEDILHDHIEEKQLALASPEEAKLKRKANSSNISSKTKTIKDSFDVKLGGQVDERASSRIEMVKDPNDDALAIQVSEKILPIKTIKGDVHLPDDRLEDGDSDPKAFTMMGVDVDPISTSIHCDPSLSTQVSSVTDVRGYHRDDMSKVQDGMFVQDPVEKYLRIARVKSAPDYKHTQDEVRMHLSNLGWEVKHIAYEKPVYHYISPDGKTFYSLIKVCEALRPTKDNITAQCSQNVDKSSVDSSVAPLHSSVQQVPSPQIFQQQCFSEGHGVTPLGEQGSKKTSEKSKIGSVSKTKETLEVEPEYCPGALVALCRLEPTPNLSQKNLAALRSKAKKHLSAMGWTFWYVRKNEGRELRYASPYDKVYNSLRTACLSCLKEGVSKSTRPMQGSIMDEKSIGQEMHGNLSSAIVCTETEEFPMLVNRKSGSAPTCELSQSRDFESGNMKVKRVKGPRKRKRDNSLACTSRLKANCSDIRQDSMSLAVLFSKTQGEILDQNPSSQEQKKRKKVRALTRKGDHLDGSTASRVPRSNKRARQVVASNPAHFFPRTILSWLVDNNVVLPREKVYYMRRNQSRPMAEGKITRDGIKCSCCQKVYGLSSFEVHAGSTYRRPAENIFLEDGRSLLDCQKQLVLDGKSTDNISEPSQRIKSYLQNNKNDCICSVCHYGGTLVLCDHCPSSFHLSCIGLEEVPRGKWFCPSCQCGLCGQGEFNGNVKQFTDKTILFCDQCEREYHVGCVGKQSATKLDSCPEENWFCSEKCEKIFMSLHKLLGKSIPVGVDNLSWSILKFSKDGYESDACNTLTMAELHSKLNVALSVMHECFEPVKEPQTKDLVKDVIFNRRSILKRLDFRGFYTVLLEKEDELISVATIRVYGGKVAEVPLIGTRVQYRRKGMCRMLMNLLEKKLAEFGVERLLLPAIPQVLHAWTTTFGFSKMTNSERLEFVEYTFLDFQDTTMCQKILKSGLTLKVVGPKANQYGYQNELNLSNVDAAFDGGNGDSEVTRQDEQSDIMEQIPVGAPACNDCSTTETDFPLITSTQMLWSKYENYSTESAEKEKIDEDSEKTDYFKCYRRRKDDSQANVCDSILSPPIPINNIA